MEKVMSRPASADEQILMNARKTIASAQTLEQLRQAQAVVLPLDYGMLLGDTAQRIGVSPGWACQLRRRLSMNTKQARQMRPLRVDESARTWACKKSVIFWLPSSGCNLPDCFGLQQNATSL
jgi:hypothetical protein